MEQAKAKIERYINIIRSQLNVEMIVIFGSYLRDAYTDDSDIDILVVATEFSQMSKLEAYKILSKPIWELKVNLDPIPATPEEIKNYDHASFMAEIMNTGKVLYQKSA